ncbi:hypothetical protein J7E37_21165 [Bacillus sp. ISL-39]|nr:hypothetical protein [Bacillus sp. ISL-39]
MAKGIASAVINSGTRFEKMVLKNKKVENKAAKANTPNKIKESFLSIRSSSFLFQPFSYNHYELTHLLV